MKRKESLVGWTTKDWFLDFKGVYFPSEAEHEHIYEKRERGLKTKVRITIEELPF